MGLDSLLPLGALFYQSQNTFFRSEAEFLTWKLGCYLAEELQRTILSPATSLVTSSFS
jgi:hypothetical protein